jgi:NTE family protein
MDGRMRGSALFDALPLDIQEALARHLVPISLEGGATLMREGEEADGLYLVRAGRLLARRCMGDETVVLGEIGRGEVVGEAALLTAQPRSATVVALRDTELLRLSVEAFESVVAEHPTFLRPVAAQVVSRMLAAGSGPPTARPVTTVAVVPVHATPAADQAARALAAALVAVVGRATIAGPDDEPSAGPTGLTDAERAQALESEHDLVVYRADADDGAWTRRCLRQADAVVLVADAAQRPDRTSIEELVAAHRARIELPVELVLVHPPDCDEPSETRRWLERRSVRRHHHVRAGDAAHVARVARLLTNRGIGLVLSGGGARSMAEIGVVQAMVELGIPIDAVGGTSAGSLVAGAVARGWSVERIRSVVRKAVVESSNPVDLTVPVTSLASGRRMTDRLREAAGELDLEDLWLDFFCVSTNLSRNRPWVHRRGRGWRAIRASMSIPGVFPPVAEDGDVLVDGGLVDNLPVGEMRRGHAGITVVAVDVGVRRGLAAGDLPDSTVVHGWQVVLDRVHPRRRSPEMAGMLTILARLSELGGGGGDRGTDRGDVLVRPDVERFALLDFSSFDRLIEVGHSAAEPVLRSWWEADHGT